MSNKHEHSPAILNALGLCFQGDVLAAYGYLLHQRDKGQQEERFLQQLHDRFLVNDPKYEVNSGDVWVCNVVMAYYRYFTAVLTKRVSLSTGEEMLLTELNKFVVSNSLQTAEEKLKQGFAARGYYFLGGKTQPYWGPYIWKAQESRTFNVVIPSGTQQCTVYFMKDFLMTSWLEFATFGLKSTRGWAKYEGIYCVDERYTSLENNPEFEVSLLKHEAQHLADYGVFPDLQAKDLEYRAKLVELIYYPTKDKLFEFITQAAEDVDNAHAYAAYTIMSRLSKLLLHSKVELEWHKWDEVSVEQLHDIALKLLCKHTNNLLSGSTGI